MSIKSSFIICNNYNNENIDETFPHCTFVCDYMWLHCSYNNLDKKGSKRKANGNFKPIFHFDSGGGFTCLLRFIE